MNVLKRILPTVIGMIVGWVTLFAIVAGQASPGFGIVSAYIVEVAVIIATFALLIGLANLLSVHWNRVLHRQSGWFYSLVAVIAALAVGAVSFWDIITNIAVKPGQGLLQGIMQTISQGVIGPHISAIYRFGLYPLQSSFAALLAFLLALAAFRTLRLRRGLSALLFLGAALVVLAAQVVPSIGFLRDWLVNVCATAGLRGVLLGIALGTIATVMRVLVGFDHPASE